MASRDVVWEHGENHHPGWRCNYCHMHNYYYDIVCMQNYDIIPLVRFCEVLYINLCIGHAKIFINLPPGNQKTCSVFLPLPSVYRSNRPVTGPYRVVYRSEPIELAFWFGFWIWSVFSGNRGLPTGLPKPTAGGSVDRFGKVNSACAYYTCWKNHLKVKK
jgi:hypothetical protein